MYDIFYVSKNQGNEEDWKKIKSKYPLSQKLTNVTSFDDVASKAFTKMFWIIWEDLSIKDSFNLIEYRPTKWDDMYVHVFKNEDYYDGICLFPKSMKVTQEEFESRLFEQKKEVDIIASNPKRYDKFNIDSYEDYLKAAEESTTDMFWSVWPDITVNENFKFDYKVPKCNSNIVHIFKNGDYYDGICLFPKNKLISKREFHHRFFNEKIEIDIIASSPNRYNIYYPKTYEEYISISDQMFWVVWPEVKIINEEIFNLYFSHHNSYDRRENHIFKNSCNGNESYFSGVILCSKYKLLTQTEFSNQYPADKKEYDILASKSQYAIYKINSYDEYKNILELEHQQMFWCQWPNTEILNNTVFDLYFDPKDGSLDYDRQENHVFKNLCNDSESYLSGLTLFSKSKLISKKEFDRRYLIDKKEHDIVATRYRYFRYKLESYEQYKHIFKNETQPLFWGIWPEIEIIDDTVFDLYFEPNNGKYDHDREENHTFKHLFNNKEIYTNGLVLFSKEKLISQREFTHRFLIEKKEHNTLASKHKLYDVVFISYNEPNADKNYKTLISKCPRAKRIHGVKGIHQAHIKAAELCDTDMFWVVDGDAVIEEDFNFDLVMSSYDIDCVHVWRSKNPINNLEYGNGGVKLLPRQLTIDMDVNTSDMTTSISKKFKAMNTVSNINSFNTDPFATWRSAFRECCKLASRVIERQYEEETQDRLNVWCSIGKDQPYGEFAVKGAIMGRDYGLRNKENLEALRKINDFDWLKREFDNVI